MNKYTYPALLIVLTLSCSVNRPTSKKRSEQASAAATRPVPQDIYASLSLPGENVRTKTGVYTLENGGKSLFTRLWFFDHAQETIDIQYYSFSKNVTGIIACEYVVRAADRGVKVRILMDDAASRMSTNEMKVLDSHDNIEIRVYNAGLRLGRLDKRLRK